MHIKNRTVSISVILVLIIVTSLWIVNRGGEQRQEVKDVGEDTNEKIEQEETSDEDGVPAEFEDNLDGAFEDLDAVDL
jgi:hypothetical protein